MVDKNLTPTADPPILYTDNVIITTNDDGVIFDVCQRTVGPKNFRVIVRLGMSREHAKKFVVKMSRLLAMTEGATHTRSRVGN